ncbi:HNH endonuclease signature motif containing protein [Hyphomicrobium sp.]|jgi:hypothetical protein|uniref:HNH endonuclease signature motif containing protein n=1 Tax=Hyphomicrobium sp. TaxID=82 RepID=UPI00356973A4
MKRLDLNAQQFVQYGISSELAARAASAGLTVSKVRTLSLDDLVSKFSLTSSEAKETKKAAQRQPVDKETMFTLLERSNYTCNVCHGTKGSSFIIHHIRPYAKTQDNDYRNLIVLCPNDHDLAHGGGLTMGIPAEGLERAKEKWELQVEKANALKAAQAVEVNESAIDYINVRRIEELCLQLYGKIPLTRATESLKAKGIIDAHGSFQQAYIQSHLSGGKFLFDYINSGETLHYRDLMALIAKKVEFVDLSEAIDHGKKKVAAVEGCYAFFIGGVYSNRPEIPITVITPAVVMYYTKRKIRVEWTLDPNFLFSMSAIARQGSKNRYIIYCLVRTMDADSTPGKVLLKASPLLIAQPSTFANRIPGVGWTERHDKISHDEH